MVLAAFGTSVDEATLVRQATMQPGGTDIGEVERLARVYGLDATIEEATVDRVQSLLAADRLAIVYLNRRIFALRNWGGIRHLIHHAQIHCVVPTRITPASVAYLDPLQPRPQRRTRQRFQAAVDALGRACVVCGSRKPE
ncbi:MAG: hypothetical protein ACJ8F7_10210 [Gemmataceae bacterium]